MKNKLHFIIPILIAVLMPFTALIGNKKTANANLSYGTSYYTLLDSVEYIHIKYSYDVGGEILERDFKFKPTSITQYDSYESYPVILQNNNNTSYSFNFTDELLDQYTHTLVTFTPTPIEFGASSPRYEMEYNFMYIDSINIQFRNVLCNDRQLLFNNLQGNVVTGYTYSYISNEDSDTYIPTSNSYRDFNTIFNPPFYDFKYDSGTIDNELYVFDYIDLLIEKSGDTVSQNNLRLDFYQTVSMFNTPYHINYSTYLDLVNEANYERGYIVGFDKGVENAQVSTPFEILTGGVESFLKIELFPNFYVYSLLLFALGFALFGLLIKYALGG